MVLFVLTGMHLSIAAHYCGGHLVAAKVSFDKELAGCGMSDEHMTYDHPVVKAPCCDDELSELKTDANYLFTSLNLPKPEFHVLQIFDVPETVLSTLAYVPVYHTNVFPPGTLWQPYQVSQSFVCVFLI